MNRVKMKMLALLMIVVMAFTGCASVEYGVIINENGSAKVMVKMSIDKAATNAELKKQGMTDAQLNLFWAEYIKELKAENVGEVKEVSKNGKEYLEIYQTENISKGALGRKLDLGNNSYVTTDTVYGVLDFSEIGESGSEGLAEGFAMASTSGAVTVTMTVVMPKDIVSTNGTISDTNKKQATFDLKLNQKNTIFVTTLSGQTIDTVKAKVAKANKVKKAKIKKLTAKKATKNAKKRMVVLKIGKVSNAKYEVEYGTKKNFRNAKIKITKKTTCIIKNLKKNTKYYVRVRAVKQNLAGYDVYSAWTKKSVKTKK